MKSLKCLAILLMALCSLSVSAAKKKTKKQPVVAKVDTVSIDTLSYALGKTNTQGLKQYLAARMGVDTTYIADFLEGLDCTELTEADRKVKARLSGIEIRQQVEEQIIPRIGKQVCDTVDIINHALFLEGFRAGISGEDARMGHISKDSLMTFVNEQIERRTNALMETKYGANRRAGEDFLKANAKNKNVKVTASGLQYEVLTEGTGEIPTASQKVKVNYRGTLLDGTEFDSSYKRNQPATFGCSQVIKGWTEALTMMPVGSKWKLYVPQELAYGSRDSGKIPPFSMLIFEVELLEIVK
ncbi:MAG: FKBP-type peptidyl-prolyl cis-trans isomerase [Bacteroidaceae bacterium]|nr:FKBP-type peptidyl-prolyl cis-trans isomerase [Bacteroidaceae bacterium]